MFLNGRLVLNGPKTSSSLLVKLIKKSIISPTSTIYSIQGKNEPKYFLNTSQQSTIKYASIRRIVLGGPGYTNFGHGRYRVNLSKFAYFWYAFLTAGFTFTILFDFEDFMFRGEEPCMKLEEIKRRQDTNTKAKSLNDDDVASLNDNKNSLIKSEKKAENDEDDDYDSAEKKSKANSFRQRKVMLKRNKYI